MGCLGVHFAITVEQMKGLLEAAEQGDEAVAEFMFDIEEGWDKEWLQQSDKAWDPIHRALTLDNTDDGCLNDEDGPFPLLLCVMGGQNIYRGDDYHMRLIRPDEVADVAEALEKVSASWFRARLFTIDPENCEYPIDEDEFEYAWSWFRDYPGFFRKAARAGRAVLFTASL